MSIEQQNDRCRPRATAEPLRLDGPEAQRDSAAGSFAAWRCRLDVLVSLMTLLAATLPYGWVRDADDLARSLRRVGLDGRATIERLSREAWSVAGTVAEPLILAPLCLAGGFVAARTARNGGASTRSAFESAVGHMAILAVVCECLQVFSQRAACDVFEMLLWGFVGSCGAALGARLDGVAAPHYE